MMMMMTALVWHGEGFTFPGPMGAMGAGRTNQRLGRTGLLICIGLLVLAVGGVWCQDHEGGDGGGVEAEAVSAEEVAAAAPVVPPEAVQEKRRAVEDERAKSKAHPSTPPASEAEGGLDMALIVGVAVAVLVGGAGAYFLLCSGESKPKFKGDATFLIGPCGGGKTAIFFKLLDKGGPKAPLRKTQTSMIKNEATIVVEGASKPVRIVDFPGHLRLRPKLFSNLGDCCAVIFVIDSGTFVSQAKEAAEMLLDLMCSPALLKNADRMLVVCNKTDAMPDDLAGILPKNLVKKRLETEIENLRVSRASGLGDTDENSEQMELEIEGGTFKWTDSPLAPEFIDYSAKEEGLGQIEKFIASL